MIRLSPWATVAANAMAWVLIQFGVGFLAPRIGDHWIRPHGGLYRTRAWEGGGAVYQRFLRVKRWKGALPSWGHVFGDFSLTHLTSTETLYLSRWIQESCRAELTHWAAMVPACLFFVWNPPVGWALNLLYAVVVNAPCIVVQRYNRPRLQRLLDKTAQRQGRQGPVRSDAR